MRNIFKLTAVFTAIFLYGNLKSQIAGTFSVPATYTSIAAAINDLNTQGVNGPVTILVDAGYTENAPLGGFTFSATGTAANPITFQKNGVGANPQILAYTGGTATPASAQQDGVWKFIGSDYVTIDGIDILDQNTANPATMEYGYGFFKASATDGCRNNTIKNCDISLSINNNALGSGPAADGSRGIDVVNAMYTSHTTNVTVTSAPGTNSNNKFYSNTIRNCNIGIALMGFSATTPFTNADQGNDVGGLSPLTGNNIVNFGGGGSTAPAAGVRTLYQYGINVSYNTVNNNNGSGVPHLSTLRGIFLSTATSANASVTNNTLTINSGTTTSQVSVIENSSGATAANNTITIANNLIANGTSSTTSGTYYGINNSASCAYLKITGNLFSGNSSNATSGSTYLIYNTGAVASMNTITNNSLSAAFMGTVAYSGTYYNIYNGGSTTTTTLNISSNDFSNINHNITGTGSIYFIYSGSSSANLTLNNNTWSNLTLNHSGTEYLMYNLSSTQNQLSVQSNSIVTGLTRTGAPGTTYFYYSSASSLGSSTHTISNNVVANVNAPMSGTGSFYAFYLSDGGTSPYPKKTITNNLVSNINYNGTGTFYGIYMAYLGDGGTTSGSAVSGNTVTNVSFGGYMYVLYPSTPFSPNYAPNVYNNHVNNITSNGASASVYGAYMFPGALPAFNFYKNKIYNITETGTSGAAYGIYVGSGQNLNIYNNLVGGVSTPSSTGTNKTNGIYISGGTSVNLYYNTVYLNATSTGANFGSNAVYASTTPVVTMRNNIFVNNSTPTGTEYAVAYRRSSTTLSTYSSTSNNNLFYAGTPGPNNLIYFDGVTPAQTLSAYKSIVLPMDGSSVTENPPFVSTTGSSANYLNLSTSIQTQAESGGAPVTGITDDYAGTIRNTGTPDIGAWEGNFLAAPDMSAPSILSSGFTGSACNLSSRTFTVSLSDFTGVATGSLAPRVYYKINNNAYTSVQGTLTSGTVNNGIWTFNLTYAGSNLDLISWYLVTQDAVSPANIMASPGSGFAATDVNNITTAPTNPATFMLGALNGTYVVGSAGTFTTLTQAANAYNSMCITGPVTFSLTNSVYTSSLGETFPVTFSNTVYASATNSLLIIPATGTAVSINGTTTSAAIIKFLNARYITIDGLNTNGSSITVNNINTAVSADIWLASTSGTGPGNNTIAVKNLNIFGGSTTSTNYGIIAGVDGTTPSATAGMDNDNITIQGNTIQKTYYGIYANGTATASAGGLNNWSINTNTVGPVTSGVNNIGYTGMFLGNMIGGTIDANIIRNVIYSGSYCYGLSIGSGVNTTTISSNNIYSVKYTGAGGYSGIGLDINTGLTNSQVLVKNNMISDITGDGWSSFTAGGVMAMGIGRSTTTGSVAVYHNSIGLTSGTIAGYNMATISAALVIGSSASSVTVVDNIIYNNIVNSSNASAKSYAIYSSAANTAFTTIDYNDYSVAGAQGVLGYISATDRLTLAQIQAGFGQNVNSQTVTPVFASVTDLHLPPASNVPLDNLGTPLAGVTVDIDNQPRSLTTPDMGADEFTPQACNAANAGTLTNTSYTACATQTIAITSNSVSTGIGETYQWMVSSTPGGPYSPVTSGSGSATASYTTAPLTATVVYYVLQATCSSASLTGVSNEATVSVNPMPTASITPVSPICAGQNIMLSGASNIATNFTWIGPNSFTSSVQNPTITNAPSAAQGNYTLLASAQGCTATPATVSVTVNSTNLSLLTSPPVLCLGSSSTLTALGNATAYNWSNGATTNSIVVSPSTNTVYSVVGTSSANCTATVTTTISVTNPTIAATGATVCTPGTTATLSATAFAPVSWYATSTSTNPLATGNTFTSNAVTTTTYYAQAVNTSTSSLFTTLAAGNGFAGNMFDVVAINNIDVNGFDMHFSSTGTATVEVWYRPGSFVGFESSNAGWTMAYTTTATALGSGTLTPIPGTFTVSVPAGQTYGFYVTAVSSGPQVNYTNGTALGNIYVQNADAQIKEGKGGGYFSVVNSPRVFNGQMRYTKSGCTSPMIPVVLNVGNQPTITVMAGSASVCAGGSTGLTASGATTYTWSTGSNNSVIAVTPTTTTTYTVSGENNGGGCADTAYVTVAVNPLPPVNLASSQTVACVNGPTVGLNGSPAGGVYTGSNVSTGVFTPGSAAGTYTPFYSYQDPVTFCSNSASVTIVVNPTPTVSLVASQSITCVNGSTIGLTGSPSGGVYSGSNVSNGVFTPATAGTFNPVYSFTNTSTSCSNTVSATVIVSSCTGIEKIMEKGNGIYVYPNPNTGIFTIHFNSNENYTVEVVDLTGRVILGEKTSSEKMEVNISQLANGVYFVKVKGQNITEVIKVIKE